MQFTFDLMYINITVFLQHMQNYLIPYLFSYIIFKTQTL